MFQKEETSISTECSVCGGKRVIKSPVQYNHKLLGAL